MMGPFLIAWLVGMALSIAHQEYLVKRVDPSMLSTKSGLSPFPPKPGRLLIASGIYVGLAVLAEAPSMRLTATLLAWGYNTTIALQFAQDYAQDQKKGSVTGTIRSSGFWSPPLASGDVLFPNGGSKSANASASNTAPGSPSGGGPLVA
jgi:hypothetical protein